MDIQAAGELIYWLVNGLTFFLLIAAASLAAKKRQYIALAAALIANLISLFVLLSPLVAMIASIICIIWSSSAKGKDQQQVNLNSAMPQKDRNMAKPGTIIGLLLGIGFVAAPVISYVRQEASFYDLNSQGWLILSGVIGVFMIINNIFALGKKEEIIQRAATPNIAEAKSAAPEKTSPKEEPEAKKEPAAIQGKVRCRFCNKLYSSEYNGCPHCKKK